MKKGMQNGRLIALYFVIIGIFFLQTGCKKDLLLPKSSIEKELERGIEAGFDGIIVYINQSGQSWFYSAGWNNRKEQTLANPQALFKIASISKLYEAAAVTKLVNNQQLSLDSTLAELIPEVAGKIEYADEITLKMMVGHRSGIPDFIYQPDFEKSDPIESYLTTAALVFDQPAEFKPNTSYHYSNTNYLLIGEIMDRVLGYSHHEYIQNEILNPLGLVNTYTLYNPADSNKVMSGYYKGYNPDLKSNLYTRPGGAMVASAEDVGLFLRFLIDGTLFNEKEQAIYTDIYEYEHTGWAPGYTSIARYNSDVDAVVVQFVNTSYNGLFWAELEGMYERINKIIEKEN
jgi:D-alanyl-D-alanine carboxypeptidase